MNKSFSFASALFVIMVAALIAGPQYPLSEERMVQEKASSLLLMQIDLRKEQIAEPTPERLEQTQAMGMRTEDLTSQRIFIHFDQEPTQSQLEELQDLGISVYVDSWIPPVGAHPTGFTLADMPVDKLHELAAKEYIIRLNTAEQLLEHHVNG